MQVNTIWKSRGFTLIEIMIAMLIGLFAVLAMMQVFSVSEGYRRTTTAGVEANANGLAALHAIERDVLQAGYGIVGPGALGCTVNATNNGGATNFSFNLVPVVIKKDDPVPGTDSVTILYSTADTASGVPRTITAAHAPSAANFQLNNTLGFEQNDFIIAFQPGKPCTLMQTTNNPTLPASNTLVHNSGLSPYNVPGNANFPQSPPHATAGYDNGSLIFNLGQLVNVRYQINNDELREVEIAKSNGAIFTSLSSSIVAIRAQYGIDSAAPNPAVAATVAVPNGDGMVDAWVDARTSADPLIDKTPDHPAFGTASPASVAAGWGRVTAIRLAVVARSDRFEKDAVAPATITLWNGGAIYNVPTGDARHYRYKVYQTIVPIRNLVWRSQGI
jgi:type IV pilus assembly protein PilW